MRKVKDFFLSLYDEERGAMSATGLLMMGISMIFIAVGFIVYPIVITGTDAILAYEYSANATITDETFTGLTAVTGVTPLLVLLGFVTSAVVTGFLGIQMQKAGVSARLNPAALLMLGIGVIFIAVGLIIFPVVLDGVSTVVHGGGNGDTGHGCNRHSQYQFHKRQAAAAACKPEKTLLCLCLCPFHGSQ